MKRNRVNLFCLVLAVVPAIVFARHGEALALSGKWTKTDPPINFVHIEFGEVNDRGEAVGYHHRPNGVDPPGAQVLRVVQPPDAKGVYRAGVAIRDPGSGAWVRKRRLRPSTRTR